MNKSNKPIVPKKPRRKTCTPSFEISSDKVLLVKSRDKEIVIPLLSITKVNQHHANKANGDTYDIFLVTYKLSTIDSSSKTIVDEEHTIEVDAGIYYSLLDELFSNYNFDDEE